MEVDQTREKEIKSRANRVLIGGMIITGIMYGTYNVLSNYIGALCMKLNATPTQVAIMFSIVAIVSMAAGFLLAAILEKVRIRVIILIGTVCFIIFFACMYAATSLTILYVGSVFLGVATSFVGLASVQPLITWWHAKNVGKKISALSISFSVFAIILSPVIANLLVSIGLTTTALLHGVAGGIILLLCCLFLVSNKPDYYGLHPYGLDDSVAQKGKGDYTPSGLTAKQAMRTYPFWAILISTLLLMIPAMGFVGNASTVFQSMGFDSVGAGTLISVFSGFGMLWIFVYGALSDRIGPMKANLIYVGTTLVAMIIAAIAAGVGGAIFIAVTFGVVQACSGMISAVSFGPIFGTRAIGTLIPLSLAASGIGSCIGPPFASAIYESTGSFSLFMAACALICVVVFVLLVTSTSKRAIAKVQMSDADNGNIRSI